MCGNIMKEMLWAAPPSTIEVFTIKKQIQSKPAFKHVTNVLDLSYQDKVSIPQQEWNQMLSAPNPNLKATTRANSEITS
jgi:hypothetical protein